MTPMLMEASMMRSMLPPIWIQNSFQSITEEPWASLFMENLVMMLVSLEMVTNTLGVTNSSPHKLVTQWYNESYLLYNHLATLLIPGTWSDADFCSTDSKLTNYGDKCLDKCAKRGQDYFWCHKETTLWGYCTPEHLIEQLKQNQISRELLLLSIG